MKDLLGVLLVLVFASCVVSAQAVAGKDLGVLEGGTWVGTLEYLDYGSGKRTAIRSDLNVVKKADGVWTFEYVYPDEPKANESSEVVLSGDGKTFNGQAVASKQRRDGRLEIVTTKDGDDNSKKAVFRFTYSISAKAFSIRKEVQYVGESGWFERNIYSWTR
ncbi:MAG: hypothetical protein ABIR33_03720 [Pyrinomonadaceae bacterium]